MERYIDAEKISSHIRESFSIDKTKNADICFAFIDFMNWLDEQPTADVVEVVRCKDCDYMTYFKGRVMCSRYAKKINDETWYGLVATDNEHYCSYGKRRDT